MEQTTALPERADGPDRFTWALIGQVFNALESAGYRRGSNGDVGRAISALMSLAETYEGGQS